MQLSPVELYQDGKYVEALEVCSELIELGQDDGDVHVVNAKSLLHIVDMNDNGSLNLYKGMLQTIVDRFSKQFEGSPEELIENLYRAKSELDCECSECYVEYIKNIIRKTTNTPTLAGWQEIINTWVSTALWLSCADNVFVPAIDERKKTFELSDSICEKYADEFAIPDTDKNLYDVNCVMLSESRKIFTNAKEYFESHNHGPIDVTIDITSQCLEAFLLSCSMYSFVVDSYDAKENQGKKLINRKMQVQVGHP